MPRKRKTASSGSANTAGPEPSLRAQWLGQQLRAHRERNGLTLPQAADYIQRDPTVLSRFENGIYPVRRPDVLALLDLYGVSDKTIRDGLAQLSEDNWRKGWWDDYAQDLGSKFIDLPWLESRTTGVHWYACMLVPGLLQTRRYIEALMEFAGHRAEHLIARGIELRIARQQILHGDEPKPFDAVIEEHVLHRPVGGPEVMREQFEHLLEMATQPHIEVRVVRTATAPHAGHDGMFQLYEMPEPYPDVAYIESLAGQLFIEAPAVDRFIDAYDQLREAALSPEESATLIEAVSKEFHEPRKRTR